MKLFSFFSRKKRSGEELGKQQMEEAKQESNPVSYDEQIATFQALAYAFDSEVTKETILRQVYEMTGGEFESEEYIEQNPYSILYYVYGWRDPAIKNYNYSNHCIWFDLEFFDPTSQYKWFMERMGAITNGDIEYTDISIETDSDNWEWINFKVNGVQKKWKLEKAGYIADHFVQRFSYIPAELNIKGRYTYYDDGGQQWVIDYATEEEQIEFNKRTGLNREWLGEGNHFNEPPGE
ncbi:MAG: hypothetical protein MI974_31565 [Chitinophagales bacterium]|nr:hypothetical protein [Chitinophagales bacterium]